MSLSYAKAVKDGRAFKRKSGSRRVTSDSGGESVTKQCFKEKCDIIRIVQRSRRTGTYDHMMKEEARAVFGDFTERGDVMVTHAEACEVKSSFARLAPKVRDRFKTPMVLLKWLASDDNWPEAVKLGILPEGVDVAVDAVKRVKAGKPVSERKAKVVKDVKSDVVVPEGKDRGGSTGDEE